MPVHAGRGVENGFEPHTGVEILPGEKPEERSASREHGAALRHQGRRFEQDLRRARRHHAGQRPARYGKRPLHRAGRKDDARGRDQARAAGDRDGDLAFAQQPPHICSGDILRAAVARLPHERAAAPIVVAEHGVRRQDGAVTDRDRSARRGAAGRRAARWRVPARAHKLAAASPAGPAPTIATS